MLEPQKKIVPLNMGGQRLDQVAANLYSDYSRSRLAQWIREGALLLNGLRARPRDKVVIADVLTLTANVKSAVDWAPEAMPLEIVFEDEHIIVVNKPAGIVVHPASGNPSGTLVNALLAFAPELRTLPRGGIVHRLDKDTSGILVVARSSFAHQALSAQLANRTVSRAYCAICFGALTGGGTIDAPVDRHPVSRIKMAVVPGGRRAVTHYRIAQRFRHFTKLRVDLETGRTHQIRVHMAYKKAALIGDKLYAGRHRPPQGISPRLHQAVMQFPRQALHASNLKFMHPLDGHICKFSVNFPEDLSGLLRILMEEDNYEK